MSSQKLYNIEFTVDDFDMWTFPEDLHNPEDFPTVVRFIMKPEICLEVGEEEFIDQVNCGTKVVKNAMFSLSDGDLKTEVEGKIAVYKITSESSEEVGVYKLPKFQNELKKLAGELNKHSGKEKRKCGSSNQPSCEVIKELVQLLNKQNIPCGSLFYTLRLTCFGPLITNDDGTNDSCKDSNINNLEVSCLERAAKPLRCQPKSEFEEYAAEINGNQLIVRVRKEDHLVTRVFDSNMDQDGNEIRRDDDVVTVCGCEQQVDFKFPGKFSCEPKSKCFSTLTDYQRKTSCIGTSFKNSRGLPVIRGNLKYPGRFDGSIKFDDFNKWNQRDVTENYKVKPMNARGVCCQVDSYKINRQSGGKCKLPKGIEVCKKGCEADNDVFILKIGRKNTDKNGKQHAIELEMRTPKGPDNEMKKMETREVQVNEKEFEDKKMPEKKAENAPLKGNDKGTRKKDEVKPTKGFTSKKK